MDIVTSSPALDEELIKPENWAKEKWIHSQLEWLRKHDPLRQIEPNGFDPFGMPPSTMTLKKSSKTKVYS